ncbi:nuclease A inhibitor family protein [Pedobacter steynii]|uniref:Nuclease A inhibitor-like protein n=1 Tax=Pedobacter steynii TaxID=430522 RepID=A0A1D7QF84_9SPHI|nr:nuclease A inhibitor family protein [Pedobacter steynii]AOM77275.1 hypothetical protein BFS30_08935 [Pedobacter steynii]
MENQILPELSTRIQGLFYLSESEAPLVIEQLGALSKEQVSTKIAELNAAAPDALVTVEPDAFFEKILKSADPNDDIVIANANKFQELHSFLKSNFSGIQVTRIEDGVKVPIIITAFLPDNTCVALNTYAIES